MGEKLKLPPSGGGSGDSTGSGGAASGDEPVASFWPHDAEQDWQTTQNNERHPCRPDDMCPGSKAA